MANNEIFGSSPGQFMRWLAVSGFLPAFYLSSRGCVFRFGAIAWLNLSPEP